MVELVGGSVIIRPRLVSYLLPHIKKADCSDQRIVIFPANMNRNRLAEPTSVQIGIGVVCESQNLRIGIGIIFVRWELFANYSRISETFFLSFIINNVFFLTLIYFSFEKLTGQRKL